MAIREALGEAKAKERTVEVQTFVKKYLADAVEMKRGRDLGTHGFEHQELYLFPRESFAQTASAYAKARTANAIDDPAERDAAEAEDPFDGGNAAEDDRDGDALVRRRERTAVASIVHRAPVKTKGATVKADALQTAQNRGRRVRVLRDLRLRSFVQRRYAVAGPRGGRPTPRESRRDAADFAADFAVARRRRKKRGFNPPGFARRSPIDARGDFIRRRPSRACACLRADRRVCVGGTRRWARG